MSKDGFKINLMIEICADSEEAVEDLVKNIRKVNGSYYASLEGSDRTLTVTEIPDYMTKMKNWKTIPTLPGMITNQDINPNQILAKAFDELDEVVLTGKDKEGIDFFASSCADAGDIIWHLEKCKKRLLEIVD